MSQKINPTSFKLGILQTWNYNFSFYGKNLKYYKKYFFCAKSTFLFLERYLKKKNLCLSQINFDFINQQLILTLIFFSNEKISQIFKKRFLEDIISKWWKDKIQLNIFKELYLVSSSFLIINYLFFLMDKKNLNLKKAVQETYKYLIFNSKKKKVVYTTKGIKEITLKGFKMQLTGCFDNSRSQMAKTIKCNFGSVPLTKLNGYIDFSKYNFFTKLGVCGIKIWLFYELKEL